MHTVYVNSTCEMALKNGGRYPDNSTFVTDLHEFTASDGSYIEGPRKGLAVMFKDSKKYASTGGWGFQFWERGQPKNPIVTDAATHVLRATNPRKIKTTSIPHTFHDSQMACYHSAVLSARK